MSIPKQNKNNLFFFYCNSFFLQILLNICSTSLKLPYVSQFSLRPQKEERLLLYRLSILNLNRITCFEVGVSIIFKFVELKDNLLSGTYAFEVIFIKINFKEGFMDFHQNTVIDVKRIIL